jgi:hypothetical protein
MKQFSSLVAGLENSSANCAADFSKFNQDMMNETTAGFASSELRPDALRLIEESWRSRLQLHRNIRKWHLSNKLDAGCYRACRDSFRIMRSIEDHLGEWLLVSEENQAPVRPSRAWQGAFPHSLLAETSEKFDITQNLKSGDVLISRGNAFTSAAISRLGDTSSQFSHMAMIYIDDETKKIHTIEAHIEVGVVTAELEKYLTDGKVRSALYRNRDHERAAKAAKLIFDLANRATADGANIPYDFKMDISDRSELHCSEVIDYAFELADPKSTRIPSFLNSFHLSSPYFMSQLGISTKTSFVPGDLEIDPQFELVAEWRNFSSMADTRYKDAVLMSMYNWMNQFGYKFESSGWRRQMRNWIWGFRRWPVFGELLNDRFPLNMPQQTMRTILELDDAALILHQAAKSIDIEHKKMAGISLNLPGLIGQLDLFRQRDLLIWLESQGIRPGNEVISNLGITIDPSSLHDDAQKTAILHPKFAPSLPRSS